jgi:hypothetical protein
MALKETLKLSSLQVPDTPHPQQSCDAQYEGISNQPEANETRTDYAKRLNRSYKAAVPHSIIQSYQCDFVYQRVKHRSAMNPAVR